MPKIKFRIMQLSDSRSCDYAYLPWEAAKDIFSIDNYTQVYEGEIDTPALDINEICDILFRQFNRITIEDCDRLEAMNFCGHSLSISDLILFDNNPNVAYYCDMFGWKRINLEM